MYSTLAVSDTDSTHQGHPGAIYANPGRDGRVGHACMQRLRRLQLSTPHNNHQIVLGIFRNAKVAIISCCIDQTTYRTGANRVREIQMVKVYYEGPVSYFVGFFSMRPAGFPGKSWKSRQQNPGFPGPGIPGRSRDYPVDRPIPSHSRLGRSRDPGTIP